ncbi:unnamed protein product, partial [marine sediment metagenome]
KTWEEFWGAKLEGKSYRLTYNQIVEELDTRYARFIDVEDGLLHQTDEILASLLPQEQRPLYMAGRDVVAQLRRADREAVLDFQRMVRELPEAEMQAAYDVFNAGRIQRITDIQKAEVASRLAMRGNPMAQSFFAAQAELKATILPDMRSAYMRAIGGAAEEGEQTLTGFERWLRIARTTEPSASDLRGFADKTEWVLGTADPSVRSAIDDIVAQYAEREITITPNAIVEELLNPG